MIEVFPSFYDDDIVQIHGGIDKDRGHTCEGISGSKAVIGLYKEEGSQDQDRADDMEIEIIASKSHDRIIEADEADRKDKDESGKQCTAVMQQGRPSWIGESFLSVSVNRKRNDEAGYQGSVGTGKNCEIFEQRGCEIAFFNIENDAAVDGVQAT